MTLDSLPQWSDWHTRNLGFADTPNAICCRICHLTKPAHGLHFRKDSVPVIGFSNVCRKCETATPELRLLDTRLKRIMRDPSLSPRDRELRLLDVPAEVAASKSAFAKRTRAAQLEPRFKEEWLVVRKVVAEKNKRLTLRLQQDKAPSQNGALTRDMEMFPEIRAYIFTVKACYSNIVSRLRTLADWRATIGLHMPPTYWQPDIAVLKQAWADSPDGVLRLTDNEGKVGQAFWSLAIGELLTKEERDTLSRMHQPLAVDRSTVAQVWNMHVADRDRGVKVPATFKYLVYPHERPVDPHTRQPRPFGAETPDWLRAFNGTAKLKE